LKRAVFTPGGAGAGDVQRHRVQRLRDRFAHHDAQHLPVVGREPAQDRVAHHAANGGLVDHGRAVARVGAPVLPQQGRGARGERAQAGFERVLQQQHQIGGAVLAGGDAGLLLGLRRHGREHPRGAHLQRKRAGLGQRGVERPGGFRAVVVVEQRADDGLHLCAHVLLARLLHRRVDQRADQTAAGGRAHAGRLRGEHEALLRDHDAHIDLPDLAPVRRRQRPMKRRTGAERHQQRQRSHETQHSWPSHREMHEIQPRWIVPPPRTLGWLSRSCHARGFPATGAPPAPKTGALSID
jgi:hypothetical protein